MIWEEAIPPPLDLQRSGLSPLLLDAGWECLDVLHDSG